MAYNSFENLEVWKRSCRIAVRIYGVLKDCRDYGLKDQMTRASLYSFEHFRRGGARLYSRIYPFFTHCQGLGG